MKLAAASAGILAVALGLASAGDLAMAQSAVPAAAAAAGALKASNKAIKQQHAQEARRRTLYRLAYHRKHGRYPSEAQFRQWYKRTYGAYPI
jgi:hypothetical protein